VHYVLTDLVKDVKLRPRDSHVSVGNDIKCHARGNPSPSITIKPRMSSSEMAGPGWKSFKVPPQYEGKDLTVVCSASNALDDVFETVTKNRTYHVRRK